MKEPRTRREREIWEACDGILIEVNDVKKITGDKIMQKLLSLGYKKGCSNEIYKYRRAWWELHDFDEKEIKGIKGVIDKNLENKNSPLFSDPIQQAVQLVKEKLDQAAKTKVDNLLQEKNNLQSSYNELQLGHTKVISDLDSYKQANTSLKSELSETNKTKLLLTNKNQNLEVIISELKTNHKENQELLKEQIKNLHKKYDNETKEYKALLEEQRHKFMMENYQLREKIEVLKIEQNKLLEERKNRENNTKNNIKEYVELKNRFLFLEKLIINSNKKLARSLNKKFVYSNE